MGADYQSETFKCKRADLKKHYNSIVAGAQWESGHGGYTGTFAEKDGFEIRKPGTVWTREEAQEDCHENNDKWGPTFAYDLGDDNWYIGGWCSC